MDKLIEELTYFAYDGEMSFFDITKGEAKAFLNKLGEKDDEIERLNNKEEQLIRRLEDLIIVGKQVENEWAVDICKMIIKELKGDDKE